MPRNRSSSRRITLLVLGGAVPAFLLSLIIIDPTLQLLYWLGAVAIIAAVVRVSWTNRQPLIKLSNRLPPLVSGALAGGNAWLICFVLVAIGESGLIPLPSFIRHSFILELSGSICSVLAFPLAVGGWFLVWGDNGPPHEVFHSIALNVLCGLALNAFLGAALFSLVSRIKGARAG
jgi:hypothetical protein